jgi:putative sigma-54 modulation protein
MNVEYTARQVRLTKSLQTLAEESLEHIGRILGKTAHAHITLYAERLVHVADIKLKLRQQTLVATGRDETLMGALRKALTHIEQQARRTQERTRDRKRLPREETVLKASPVSRQKSRPAIPAELPVVDFEAASRDLAPRPRKTKVKAEIPVHSFPQRKKTVEPHILHSSDSIALSPLTIEQAVKEAEFTDRDLLIFRTPQNLQYVLHRRRDGQMEIVELP